MTWWIEKCRGLEKEVDGLKTTQKTTAQASNESNEIGSDKMDAVPLPRRRSLRNQSKSQISTTSTTLETNPDAIGCGNCSSLTNCACIDQAFNLSNLAMPDGPISISSKRAHSPQLNQSKRSRPNNAYQNIIKIEPSDLETDFTTSFARDRSRSVSPPLSASTPLPSDPCGFCSDGTPCICAEMAADAADAVNEANAESRAHRITSQAAPIHPNPPQRFARILSEFTPPPSEHDVQPPTVAAATKANPCANGPGTCAQCQADPNSTFFCKTLAASRSPTQAQGQSSAQGGCCGGVAASGGCCQQRPQQIHNAEGSATSTRAPNGPTMSCADAYTTLSRHPRYQEAASDGQELGRWLPTLNTVFSRHRQNDDGVSGAVGGTMPGPQRDDLDAVLRTQEEQAQMQGRPAMEVEAASVMQVLRLFDRRFGRE